MKIFLTGASGFIGSHILHQLLDRGHSVEALSRKYFDVPKGVHLVQGDLKDPATYRYSLKGCDAVIHAGAMVSLDESCAEEMFAVNLEATRLLLEAAAALGIPHFVFLSSAGVFGSTGSVAIADGDLKPNPTTSPYYRSKALAGQLVKNFRCSGRSSVILYPTRVYGPGPFREGNQVARMLYEFSEGRWHLSAPEGKRIGNYVYVEDVAAAAVQSAENSGVNDEFLVAGDNVSYDTLFETMRFVSGRAPFLIRPSPLMLRAFIQLNKAAKKILPRMGGKLNEEVVSRLFLDFCFDGSRAAHALNYQTTTITDGFRKTLEWIRHNLKYYEK